MTSQPQTAMSAQGTPQDATLTLSDQSLIIPQPPRTTAFHDIRVQASQPVVASFIAGGVAGAISRTVVSPLERLKILLQVQGVGRNEYKMSIGKGLVKMWQQEGVRGLFSGNGANVIRIAPYSAIQFASYNVYKKFFESTPGQPLTPLMRLAVGAMAGITSCCATYPLDIVRTRLSIQSASFATLKKTEVGQKLPGMWSIMKHMYVHEGGMRALYKGLIPTVMGVAPYVGLNFCIYDSVRTYFTPKGQSNPDTLGKLGAGAISGCIAQTCTYPLDVLRRRFQINSMDGMGYKYKSIWDAVTTIVKQEGFTGLYKGITPNLLKVGPSMAASWASFELVRDLLVGLKPEPIG